MLIFARILNYVRSIIDIMCTKRDERAPSIMGNGVSIVPAQELYTCHVSIIVFGRQNMWALGSHLLEKGQAKFHKKLKHCEVIESLSTVITCEQHRSCQVRYS
jgi:hypothetical protein